MAPTDGYVPVPVIQIRWASSAPLTPPPSVLALACYEAMLLGMIAQVGGASALIRSHYSRRLPAIPVVGWCGGKHMTLDRNACRGHLPPL